MLGFGCYVWVFDCWGVAGAQTVGALCLGV